MKIIIENAISFDNISDYLGEAKSRLDHLETAFDKPEITKIVENLAASEPELAIAIGSLVENMQLNEFIVKHVDSKGNVSKTRDRETRTKQAFQTTGLSKSERRRIARKAAKTKKARPSAQIIANRKKERAMAKRKILGLD